MVCSPFIISKVTTHILKENSNLQSTITKTFKKIMETVKTKIFTNFYRNYLKIIKFDKNLVKKKVLTA